MRLVVAAALALGIAATPAIAQRVEITLRSGEVLLETRAEGTASIRPDMMRIRAGVVTTGKRARDALSANAVQANRVITAVRAQGVDPRDTRTENLEVSPIFDDSDRQRASDEDRAPRIIGYRARNSLQLTLKDLTKASAVIDAIFEAGANEVRGPTFGVDDEARYTSVVRKAREDAIRLAREQADTYASALGMRVARVLRVSERGDLSDNDSLSEVVVTGSRIAATPIEPGEIDVEREVWVDFALVPR